MPRTFVIGDIHGDLQSLDLLLGQLPVRDEDTVVFLGDYVDRGPASRQVVERVRTYARAFPGKTVCLRGNHEDAWMSMHAEPDPGFLLPEGNGTLKMMESYVDCTGLSDEDKMAKLFDVKSWLPEETVAWFKSLPVWYEDDNAIYVHAGLDGKNQTWKHPTQGREVAMLWTRNSDFWIYYQGKKLCFGHTPVTSLPNDHLTWLQQIFDKKDDVWKRGDLYGLDTGAGKGGFVSAVELPSGKVYEGREPR
jgi:serine/threonine protein phosphatase 1